MNLDESIKELEKIATQLEDVNLSMEDGVKLYEKGAEIAKSCYDELTKVKGKVNIIEKDLEKYKEENFDWE